MKLQFWGAMGTVTGSRFRLEGGGSSVLVDCGMFQGPKEIRQKNWEPLRGTEHLDAVLLTHAHIDHSGLLPKLVRDGFDRPIYCSPATAELCRIMLTDAGRLQEEDARFLGDRHLSRHDPPLPLYTEDDAIEALRFLNPCEDEEWNPALGDLRFRFWRAGHILGARMVEVSDDRVRALFTGDLGPNEPLVLRPRVNVGETDYLIMESTYGDRCHETGDRKEQLLNVVTKVITRGGTLVIPAFSVGRTQDILFLLGQLLREGRLPKVPVYVDSPMANSATALYRKFADELRPDLRGDEFVGPLEALDFKAVKSADDSMLLCMDTSPKIVISAAGMLTGGRVLHHLKAKLPDEKSGVLFVGYQVPESKGWLLKNGFRSIRIHNQTIDIEAEIFAIDSLSAHADSNELIEWCRGFRRPPKCTYLVHGEDAARRTLSYRLRHELGWEVRVPAEGETVELK